jgi:hypothetical protein
MVEALADLHSVVADEDESTASDEEGA